MAQRPIGPRPEDDLTDSPPIPEPDSDSSKPDIPAAYAEPAAPKPIRRRGFPYGVAALALLVIAAGATSHWWLPYATPERQVAAPAAEAPMAEAPVAEAPVAEAPPPLPAPDTALADRVDTLEREVRSLIGAADTLATKSDNAVLADRVSALEDKLGSVEARPSADPQALSALAERLKSVEAKLAQREVAAHDERALALASAQLSAALAESDPFAPQVELLHAAANDDPALTAPLDTLSSHAKAGVPSRVALLAGLEALPDLLSQPAPPPEDASYWERIERRMSGLVTVRRIDGGDDKASAPPSPDQLLAAAAAEMRGGDLAAAVTTVKRLDGHAADVARPWLEQAQARLDVEQAARDIAAIAARHLAGDGGVAP